MKYINQTTDRQGNITRVEEDENGVRFEIRTTATGTRTTSRSEAPKKRTRTKKAVQE